MGNAIQDQVDALEIFSPLPLPTFLQDIWVLHFYLATRATLILLISWQQLERNSPVGKQNLFLFSFAERLILVKHVLASMPLHVAMVLPLPKSTCKSIERLMMIFLWSGSESKQLGKKNCLPKEEDGLGLKRTSELNDVCFMKVGWRAFTSSSIWVVWFRDRYMKKRPLSSLSILGCWLLRLEKKKNQIPFTSPSSRYSVEDRQWKTNQSVVL